MLTITDVQQALPPQLKINVSQDLVDMVNNLSSDPEAARVVRENFLSYTNVLKEGRFKTEDYVNAVGYVSFKMMGYTNREAYARTFPARYQALVAKGTSDKDISAYVAAYNKGKLVNLVLEQTLIPAWILNQEAYQKAINTQLDVMTSSKSDIARTQAANSLLTHLKRPEVKKVELDISAVDASGLNELRDSMRKLAEQQIALIEAGAQTKKVAQHDIIEAVVIPEDPAP